ncbi:MAG: PepSY domain-containing protein [Planctomycetota bacterium]
MNPNKKLWLVGLAFLGLGLALAGCDEEEVALTEVPDKALEAAKEAVPGIQLTEAEVEETSGGMVFEVEGTLDGVEYEIRISADGKVLGVEKEGEEDDEDEDEGEDGDEEEGEGEDDD